MTKSGMNLQDSFLNQVRKENTEIMLVLLDGTRLNGYVRGFDNFTVIMNVRGSQHLIYKHAIAQIVSRRMTHPEIEGRENAAAHGHGDVHTEAPQPVPAGEGEAPAEAAEPQRPEGPPRREGGGRHEGGRRERDRDRDREREEAQANKPKFNTIDFSAIKFEQEKKG